MNKEKYNEAFKKIFDLKDEEIGAQLVYQSIPEWDSIGHMALVAELEDRFDIMMNTDDIIDFSSYEKGIEILKKYDVDIQG